MKPFDPQNPFGEEGLLATMIRLADEKDQSWRFTKKGDKRPWYDVEAAKLGNQKRKQAKRDAAAERILAANKAKRPAPGQDIARRMLKVMEPGKWYGMGDLMRLIDGDRYQRGKVHQVLVKRGWVEKANNPAYSDQILNPWKIMAGHEPQPKHLYRVTEAGLKAIDG